MHISEVDGTAVDGLKITADVTASVYEGQIVFDSPTYKTKGSIVTRKEVPLHLVQKVKGNKQRVTLSKELMEAQALADFDQLEEIRKKAQGQAIEKKIRTKVKACIDQDKGEGLLDYLHSHNPNALTPKIKKLASALSQAHDDSVKTELLQAIDDSSLYKYEKKLPLVRSEILGITQQVRNELMEKINLLVGNKMSPVEHRGFASFNVPISHNNMKGVNRLTLDLFAKLRAEILKMVSFLAYCGYYHGYPNAPKVLHPHMLLACGKIDVIDQYMKDRWVKLWEDSRLAKAYGPLRWINDPVKIIRNLDDSHVINIARYVPKAGDDELGKIGRRTFDRNWEKLIVVEKEKEVPQNETLQILMETLVAADKSKLRISDRGWLEFFSLPDHLDKHYPSVKDRAQKLLEALKAFLPPSSVMDVQSATLSINSGTISISIPLRSVDTNRETPDAIQDSTHLNEHVEEDKSDTNAPLQLIESIKSFFATSLISVINSPAISISNGIVTISSSFLSNGQNKHDSSLQFDDQALSLKLGQIKDPTLDKEEIMYEDS